MSETTYVIHHRDCADGFGAAWAAYQKLGQEKVEYPACAYGEQPPEIEPGSRVYILDFSFPRETMLDLIERHDVVLLDHHETAEKDIGDLPGCRFDTSRSGAVLAWNWFNGNQQEPPELLRYVEDRDLWKWELPKSREVSAALDSHPKYFSTWERLDVGELAREGEAILRHDRVQVERIVRNSGWQKIGGWTVPVVNTPLLVSEVCEALLEKFPGAPFAAAYHDRGGRRKWSLRSAGKFDVSVVAQALGGGGHPHAAGVLEEV